MDVQRSEQGRWLSVVSLPPRRLGLYSGHRTHNCTCTTRHSALWELQELQGRVVCPWFSLIEYFRSAGSQPAGSCSGRASTAQSDRLQFSIWVWQPACDTNAAEPHPVERSGPVGARWASSQGGEQVESWARAVDRLTLGRRSKRSNGGCWTTWDASAARCSPLAQPDVHATIWCAEHAVHPAVVCKAWATESRRMG